jgi:hypothetical protein
VVRSGGAFDPIRARLWFQSHRDKSHFPYPVVELEGISAFRSHRRRIVAHEAPKPGSLDEAFQSVKRVPKRSVPEQIPDQRKRRGEHHAHDHAAADAAYFLLRFLVRLAGRSRLDGGLTP